MSGEDDDDKKPRAKRREHRLAQTQTSRFSLNRKQRSLLLYVICVQSTKFKFEWNWEPLISGQIVNSFGQEKCTFDYLGLLKTIPLTTMSQQAQAC